MAGRRLNAVPEAPKRAGFYIRVSDVAGREADKFMSPDLQLDAVRKYAQARGLVEVAQWSDIDRTGRDFQREGIQAAIAAARAGEIDALVMLDVSRLGRNTGESLRVIEELRGLSVSVYSTVEQFDESPEGQFMLGQFLGMAQLYSDQLGRRWRAVHAHMLEGGRQSGQPPIGYRMTETGKRTPTGRPVLTGPVLVDPVMGPAMTQAFSDYAAGVPTRVIARRLADLRGKPYWTSQLRSVLRSPFYLGRVRYLGQERPGVHPALVDEATWQACQRRADRDAQAPPRRLEVAHALSGLVVCDECGSHLWLRATKRRGGAQSKYLGCPRQADQRSCAGCGSLSVAAVERAVLDQLKDYLALLQVDDVAQATRRARETQARSDVAHLEGELKRNRSVRARLAIDRASRTITAQAFADADAQLAEVEVGLLRALEAAQRVQSVPSRGVVAAVAELLDLWSAASIPQRNLMLRALVDQVRVRRGEGWRQPADERVEVVPL